jgi:hypothetical protein
MIRYSCDLCKRDLDPEQDLRYVVKMEIFAAMNTSKEDDDNDPLEDIEDLIERQADDASESIAEEISQQLRFDLCPDCRDKFVKHPLGREQFAAVVGFSKN